MQCTACEQSKPCHDFYKDNKSSRGYKYQCKQCSRAAAKSWKQNNKDRVLEAERALRRHRKFQAKPTAAWKICSKCSQFKHLEDYGKEPKNRDGKRSDCNQCKSEARRRSTYIKKGLPVPEKRIPDSREERLNKKRDKDMRRRERNMQEYLSVHGVPPLCECGCGVRVNFGAKGTPNRFAGPGHQSRLNPEQRSQMFAEKRAEYRERSGAIPIEDFVAAVRQLKEKEGLTWEELAERSGTSRGHLLNLIYNKNEVKSVGREWGTNFFKRLAGMPAPPSKYQLSKIKAKNKALRETESKI